MTDEMVANAPILILGNKIDLPQAVGDDQLRQEFGLLGLTTGKVRTLQGTSVREKSFCSNLYGPSLL